MSTTLDTLAQLGVVPVVKIERVADAVPLGQALRAGDLPCAEITFRTSAAEEAIRNLVAELPDVLVGAGTVLTVEQAAAAVAAGARYIVSPCFDDAVVDWCLEHETPVIPGVATPTEINRARKKGLRTLKFFPAEPLGGTAMLKALAAVYPEVKFIPTGGISVQNLADYVRLPMVHAIGGSWMVASRLLAAGDFAEVTRLAREARQIVERVRACT